MRGSAGAGRVAHHESHAQTEEGAAIVGERAQFALVEPEPRHAGVDLDDGAELAVEPVRQRGPARQAEPQAVEMRFQVVAALRAAMHGNAGGLVDDQHQPGPVQKAGNHLFRVHARDAI